RRRKRSRRSSARSQRGGYKQSKRFCSLRKKARSFKTPLLPLTNCCHIRAKKAAFFTPGVTTFDTAGHTPGHMSVHISSGSEEMLLTGDVVVDTAISFQHPEWAFGFDLDVPLATKARMAFLDRAAADKTLVGSYHLPFPGFGHVVREGSGYRWLPADWQWTS